MWIKICGVRDPASARKIADLGPDAIGLNFYPRSRRYITPETALEIVKVLPDAVEPVGLFVDASFEEIRRITEPCGIRTIQLHGRESPEVLSELNDYEIIPAIRVGDEGLGPVCQHLQVLKTRNIIPKAILLDADVPGEFGGTGQTLPWERLRREWPSDVQVPFILAGGLTPENVQQAICCVHPWGVDVATGVESEPGVKDLALVRAFIENARAVS